MNSEHREALDFFFEVGIINQLSSRLFASCLEDGLHLSQISVLRHLIRRGDGVTPLQLARAFQVPKTSMTNSLSMLERRSLIELRPNPDDGRSKLVYLTADGHDCFARVMERTAELAARMEAYLDFEQLARLRPQLAQIRTALDDNRED